MNVWDEWEYDITYIDNDEMSHIHVLTNKENLGIIIDEIVDKGGFDIKVKRREN